jgi:unsaturated chondroitin disaccharide hydrolase
MGKYMIEQKYLDVYEKTIAKVIKNSKRIKATFPHVAVCENGQYSSEEPWFWTGGFWGGLLRLAYRETGLDSLLQLMRELENKQDVNLDQFMKMHHDVGFLWLPTSVANYNATKDEASLCRGIKRAGFSIIDCMMNLSLLYWASKVADDPRFYHIAVSHADTVLTNFVRPDYTVPHIVEFDPYTGKRIGTIQGQGKGPNSVWSRGQAWAIYGFAISYRETGDNRYLEVANKIANKYMSSLPKEGIPYYDFLADESDNWVFDSSSACITASGLLELFKLTKEEWYLEKAIKLLDALIANYCDFTDKTEGIIMMGTVSKPNDKHINVPIIYGDYFFLEALGKLKGLEGLF